MQTENTNTETNTAQRENSLVNIKPKIEDCAYSLKQTYEKQGYAIDLAGNDISIELAKKQ